MPRTRKLKESQDWDPEDSAGKKAKSEAPALDVEDLKTKVVQAISFFNDPNGSTFATISKQLEAQNIMLDGPDLRKVLKSAVESGDLTQPNRARWKATHVEAKPVAPAPAKPVITNAAEPENNSFVGLSRDIAVEVMGYLSMAEIFRLRRVCKGWLELVESRRLWRTIDFVSTNAEIPLSVVAYLLQAANGQVENFTLDGNNLFMNKENLTLDDVTGTLFTNSVQLKRLELFNYIVNPFQLLSTCVNLHTLTLVGYPVELGTLAEMVPSLPFLKYLFISIHNPKKKKRNTDIVTSLEIPWGPLFKSLHIESDGSPYHFNVPKGLKRFSFAQNPSNPVKHWWHAPSKISNIEEIFTENLVSYQVYEVSTKAEEIKLIQENCLHIKTLGVFLDGTFGYLPNRPTLSMVLPDLTDLTIKSGGFVTNWDCPNLETLEIDPGQLSVDFAGVSKLKSVTVRGSHRDLPIDFLYKASELKEASLITMDNNFHWPKIEQLSILIAGRDTFWNNLKSLKILELQGIQVPDLVVELPNLVEFTLAGSFTTDSPESATASVFLNTPLLKIFNAERAKCAEIKNLCESTYSLDVLKVRNVPLKCLSFLNPKELHLVNRTMQSPDLDDVVACSSVEILDFSECEMTDKGVGRFAEGLKTRLKGIHLSEEISNESGIFTDKSIYSLAKVCPNLEELVLNNCQNITGGSIHDLLLINKNVKMISVTRCKRVTKAAILKGLEKPKFACYINSKRVL